MNAIHHGISLDLAGMENLNIFLPQPYYDLICSGESWDWIWGIPPPLSLKNTAMLWSSDLITVLFFKLPAVCSKATGSLVWVSTALTNVVSKFLTFATIGVHYLTLDYCAGSLLGPVWCVSLHKVWYWFIISTRLALALVKLALAVLFFGGWTNPSTSLDKLFSNKTSGFLKETRGFGFWITLTCSRPHGWTYIPQH